MVLARSEPGLADREDHPAGYRVIRVPVSARSGLPRPLRRFVPGVRRAGPPTIGRRDAAAAAEPEAIGREPRRGYVADPEPGSPRRGASVRSP